MIQLFGYGAAGLAAALLLVPLCRYLAVRYGFVAAPRVDRWHQRPIAMLGGIAISVPVLLGGLTLPFAVMGVVLSSAFLMFLVGLIDDLVRLKPATKLVAEIGITSILLFFGFRLQWTESLLLDALITTIWIVGV